MRCVGWVKGVSLCIRHALLWRRRSVNKCEVWRSVSWCDEGCDGQIG
jgi:hypothetical protein